METELVVQVATALPDEPCRDAPDDGERGDVLGHHRPGGNDRPLAHGHPGEDGGPGGDEGPVVDGHRSDDDPEPHVLRVMLQGEDLDVPADVVVDRAPPTTVQEDVVADDGVRADAHPARGVEGGPPVDAGPLAHAHAEGASVDQQPEAVHRDTSHEEGDEETEALQVALECAFGSLHQVRQPHQGPASLSTVVAGIGLPGSARVGEPPSLRTPAAARALRSRRTQRE